MDSIKKVEDQSAATKLNIDSIYGLDKGKNIEVYFWKPTASDMLTAKSLIADNNNLHAKYGLLSLPDFGFYDSSFIQEYVGYILSEFDELGIVPSYSIVTSPQTTTGGLVDLTIGVTNFQPSSNGKTASGVVFWNSETGLGKDADSETPMLFNNKSSMLNDVEAAHVVRHEFGHAMGLNHPQDVGLQTKYDSFKYTVMSYTYHPNLNGVYPVTLMMLDYLALQQQGRLSTSYKNGANTQWFWSDISGPILATIYDTGGEHDYISAMGHSTASIIDLRDGHFSSYGVGVDGDTALENLAILWDSKIEDAIGSDNDDVLIGNDIGNVLKGGKGNDFIYGNGLNYDTTNWNFSAAHKSAYAATVDTENNNIDDKDTIYGGEGNDYIDGQSGNDSLYGDEGHDFIFGGMGDDSIEGGEGSDHLYGGDGKYALYDGADTLNGGEGNDILEGGSGNDKYIFTGQFGRDIILDSDSQGSLEFGGTTLSQLTQSAKDSIVYYDNIDNPTKKAIVIDEGNTKSLIISTDQKRK